MALTSGGSSQQLQIQPTDAVTSQMDCVRLLSSDCQPAITQLLSFCTGPSIAMDIGLLTDATTPAADDPMLVFAVSSSDVLAGINTELQRIAGDYGGSVGFISSV